MIDLTHDETVLARFARDLHAQSPRALGEVEIDFAAHSAEDIRVAQRAWSGRIVDEHRSVAVFSELLRLLADIEAPFDVLAAVQRLIGDELRHVSLCAELAYALDAPDVARVDLASLSPPRFDVHPAERALELVVRELAIAETESIAVLVAHRDATEERAVAHLLDILVLDEARHAAAGFAIARLIAARFPDETAELRRALPTIARADVAAIRGIYRGAATGGPGRGLGASLRAEDLVAPGRDVVAFCRAL